MNAKLILATTLLIIASSTISAQERYTRAKAPKWVSEKGFWQIETNIHTPDKNIVYFYNNDNVLVYKENVNGVVFDLQKKSVKMRLKRALEAAVVAWNRSPVHQNDQHWITMLFKK